MITLSQPLAGKTSPRALADDARLSRKICREFVEMPGLHLTLEQAQRLWALDAPTCTSLLERLVDLKFLARDADGRYGRLFAPPLNRREP
jgi:hypothetical protein